MVYKEVLEPNLEERELVPFEVTNPEEEVEDISRWLDYDAIEAEFEFEFEGDTNIEEAQPVQADIRRRLNKVRKTPIRLNKKTPRHAVPLPPINVTSIDYSSMCEYERIREDNIAERNAEYLRIFGEPWDDSKGQFSKLK